MDYESFTESLNSSIESSCISGTTASICEIVNCGGGDSGDNNKKKKVSFLLSRDKIQENGVNLSCLFDTNDLIDNDTQDTQSDNDNDNDKSELINNYKLLQIENNELNKKNLEHQYQYGYINELILLNNKLHYQLNKSQSDLRKIGYKIDNLYKIFENKRISLIDESYTTETTTTNTTTIDHTALEIVDLDCNLFKLDQIGKIIDDLNISI